tara:strand:- start:257 stop:484 length:228 start_codon:yes stop_codon:yes gene_type:complete
MSLEKELEVYQHCMGHLNCANNKVNISVSRGDEGSEVDQAIIRIVDNQHNLNIAHNNEIHTSIMRYEDETLQINY